jgi:hypothetical protein
MSGTQEEYHECIIKFPIGLGIKLKVLNIDLMVYIILPLPQLCSYFQLFPTTQG